MKCEKICSREEKILKDSSNKILPTHKATFLQTQTKMSLRPRYPGCLTLQVLIMDRQEPLEKRVDGKRMKVIMSKGTRRSLKRRAHHMATAIKAGDKEIGIAIDVINCSLRSGVRVSFVES